ncbi:MAG: zinc ABC transporter substrate-binding protein [Alphaproteobacteria bacterium]|nr:zinc ABC transporter substrate-binding protein [Alphaproteobacteria bacterium SS10]
MQVSRRLFIVSALALSLVFSPVSAEATGKPYRIVATTGMLADLIQVIGGEVVQVQALMGPGIDPHAYRQTRSDIVAMANADLVIWHGLYLEAQLEDFMAELGERQAVVALGDQVSTDQLLAHDDYDGRYDPHVWMNPVLWGQVVDAAVAALSQNFPRDAELFATNADSYRGELAALATYADTVLATVPEAARVLISAHDAFNYFGDAYGFDVVGIQGISTESEAGLRRIEALVDRLVEDDVRAVFVESSVADRNVRALIEGAAARGHEVSIGGELFSDAMGPAGTYEGSYLGMIDHNATTITRALGGEAPAQGRLGKLGIEG